MASRVRRSSIASLGLATATMRDMGSVFCVLLAWQQRRGRDSNDTVQDVADYPRVVSDCRKVSRFEVLHRAL
jgi:hypothetical protein